MYVLKKVRVLLGALFLFVFTFNIVGCAGSPPLIEQAKAVEAEKYARTNYALKHAPKLYRAGKRYLKTAYFFSALRVFIFKLGFMYNP